MVIHGPVLQQPSSLVSHSHSAASTVVRAISSFARPGAFSLPAGRVAAAARAGSNLVALPCSSSSYCGSLSSPPSSPPTALPRSSSWPPPRSPSPTPFSSASFPNSALLRRILDRRLVFVVFVAVVIVELALAGALGKLFVAFAVVAPIIVAHAVLRIPDDLVAAEDGKAAGDLIAVSEKKGVDLEAGGGGQISDRSS